MCPFGRYFGTGLFLGLISLRGRGQERSGIRRLPPVGDDSPLADKTGTARHLFALRGATTDPQIRKYDRMHRGNASAEGANERRQTLTGNGQSVARAGAFRTLSTLSPATADADLPVCAWRPDLCVGEGACIAINRYLLYLLRCKYFSMPAPCCGLSASTAHRRSIGAARCSDSLGKALSLDDRQSIYLVCTKYVSYILINMSPYHMSRGKRSEEKT